MLYINLVSKVDTGLSFEVLKILQVLSKPCSFLWFLIYLEVICINIPRSKDLVNFLGHV